MIVVHNIIVEAYYRSMTKYKNHQLKGQCDHTEGEN